MPLPFNDIPSNIRVPLFYAEFDNSAAQSGPSILAYRGLLIGQRTSTGLVAENIPTRITSPEQAGESFGLGSQLHRQVISWFASNTFTELWCIALDDNAGGVAAKGSVTINGGIFESGTLNFYIGGERVQVPVVLGDTVNDLAADLDAAINADDNLRVTSAVSLGTLTLTDKVKGEEGNSIDLRFNLNDEEMPSSLSPAIQAMGTVTAGSANPDISTAIAAMGDEWYQIMSMPYRDTANMTLMEAELTRRFGPTTMIDGMCCIAMNDTLNNMGAFGDSRNSPHMQLSECYQEPRPESEVAAETAALMAKYGQNDPARPFQFLNYAHRIAKSEADRFTLAERNLLLFDSVSTFHVNANGQVAVDRLITMYQENAAGAPDTSYLDVNTLLTLMYIRYDWRVYIVNKYPRHKLADDGTRFGPGQPIMTPKLAKSEAISKFEDWEKIGLVENIDQFKSELIAERNVSDPNRLDVLLPPNLVNQLRIFASLIRFFL